MFAKFLFCGVKNGNIFNLPLMVCLNLEMNTTINGKFVFICIGTEKRKTNRFFSFQFFKKLVSHLPVFIMIMEKKTNQPRFNR